MSCKNIRIELHLQRTQPKRIQGKKMSENDVRLIEKVEGAGGINCKVAIV